MKICREVNGIPMEFELTSREMVDAYYAKKFEWDKNYILELVGEYYADGDDCPVGAYDELRADHELLGRVANRYRKYLEDQYGSDTEWACFKDAYSYAKRNS